MAVGEWASLFQGSLDRFQRSWIEGWLGEG